MGVMAALFGGVLIEPYREGSLIIRPGQAIWVPLQGEFSMVELNRVLKQVWVPGAFGHLSAEHVIADRDFQRQPKLETKHKVFFGHELGRPGMGNKWGPRKYAQAEVIVKGKWGVIEARRPA